MERRSAEQWATALGTDPRATGLVLEVLVASGVAARDEAGYGGSEAFRTTLAQSPGGTSMALLLWSSVGAFVRNGAPLFEMDGDGRARAGAYSRVVAGLGDMFAPAAAALAAALGGGARAVLDVGCGSGVWGLALGQRDGARVTGLDWPEVLAAFQARADALGMRDRVEVIPGDMHAADFPRRRFDRVLIANVLRLEGPREAKALVARLSGALGPGGKLVVVDALAHGSREKDLARTIYGLHLGLRTRRGQVHAPEVVTGWLLAAGLKDVRPIDLGVQPGAVAAVVGTVP